MKTNIHTEIRYITVVSEKDKYTYYNVDIRQKGHRFKKRFPLTVQGLSNAIDYVDETIEYLDGIEKE